MTSLSRSFDSFMLSLAVRRGVDRLSNEDREIIYTVLYALQEGRLINVSASAKIAGLSFSGFYGRLGRALLALREELLKEPEVQTWLKNTRDTDEDNAVSNVIKMARMTRDEIKLSIVSKE